MTKLIIGFFLGVLSSILLSIGMYIAEKRKKPKEKRLHISMVKPEQEFKLEHDEALYEICTGYCISNDTYKKEILFEIHWAENSKRYTQQYILPYNAKEFKHFHLLNIKEFKIPSKNYDETLNDNDQKKQKIQEEIKELKSMLNKHIQKEEYEKAQEIQNKIDKLNKKDE